MTPTEYYAAHTGIHLAKQAMLIALDTACRQLEAKRKDAFILGLKMTHERKDGKDYLNGLFIKAYACKPTKEQFRRAMIQHRDRGGAKWLSFADTIEGGQKCTFEQLYSAYIAHNSLGG